MPSPPPATGVGDRSPEGLLDRAREVALDGQHAAIISRAAAQDPRARELLNLLALVAREVPARALALAAGAPEQDVLDELGALSRSGLARLGEQGWRPPTTWSATSWSRPCPARSRPIARAARRRPGAAETPNRANWPGTGSARATPCAQVRLTE